jgi:hypothetical protein
MSHCKLLSKCLFFGLPVIFLVFCNPGHIFGARYIVDSKTSSDAWESAKWNNYPAPPNSTPCRPDTALKNAASGDIVYFRSGQGGNYDIRPTNSWTTPKWNPEHSGTKESPIIFRNFPGETPILRNVNTGCKEGDDSCKNPIIGSNGRDYVIWDGFQLGITSDKNLEGNPKVRFDSCRGCVLRNCKIYIVNAYVDIYYSNYTGISLQWVYDTTIKNNFITGGTQMWEEQGNTPSSAILMYLATNTLVENNSIIHTASGINDKTTARNNVYRNNFLYETGTHGIWFGGASGEGSSAKGIKVYQNIIVSTNPYAKLIWIDDDSVGEGHGDDFEVYSNVLYAPQITQAGIVAEDVTNDRYWNNIICGGFKEGTFRFPGINSQPDYMDYNIYHDTQKFLIRVYEANTSYYTTLSSWQASGELVNGGNPDVHSVYANPQFVNAGGMTPDDYKLTATSPGNGTGRNGQNIGAFPLGNSQTQVGYLPSEKPAPPTNLRFE